MRRWYRALIELEKSGKALALSEQSITGFQSHRCSLTLWPSKNGVESTVYVVLYVLTVFEWSIVWIFNKFITIWYLLKFILFLHKVISDISYIFIISVGNKKTEAEDLKMKATFSSQDRGEIYYLFLARPVTAHC